MTSWESVLIDWCNCLELSKKVEDLNELRDGAFFKQIFSVLNKSNSPKNEEETIKDIIYLLNDTYENCNMKCSKCATFCEFTDDELVIFTSLLMHYTCIYDRRDVLTSPLCHRLSKNTQLLIKHFLQMINTEITPPAIQNMMKKCGKTLKKTVNTNDCASPLTGIFETPVSKSSKLHEKDKEIARLKNALEMESYEKADLQEELKLQVDKTKRLENLLNKSNVDMTRLRREITALECRTPPHFRAMDSSNTENRLKKEIQSLEHYIEKSEKENDEIRDECYSNRKKLADLQNHFSELQAKYFEAEKQIEEFNKLSAQQVAKISSLEAYCDELNGLLEEYQRKPENESFLETSTISVRRSLPRVEENLACSVVEVQLKEAYMENEELLNKISILNMELDENAKNMHAKIEECENKCWKMYGEIRRVEELRVIMHQMKFDYNKNIEDFTNSFQNLRQLLNNIVKNYETSLEKSKSEVDFEKNKSQSLSDMLKKTVEEHEESVKSFEVELRRKEDELESFKLNNEELVANIKLIEETNTKNSQKIQELEKIMKEKEIESINVINDLKLNCQQLTIQNEELLTNLEEIKENNFIVKESLEKTIEAKEIELSKYVNEIDGYLSDLTTMKSESEELLRNNKELVSELSEKTSKIALLEKNAKDIQDELNFISRQKDEYKENLDALEIESKNLSKQIEQLISKLSLSEDMNAKVSHELQKLQHEIERKTLEFDQCINEKNEMLSISKSERDQLISEKNELNTKLSFSDGANQKYSTEIQGLKNILDQKSRELKDAEDEKVKFSREITIFQSENEDLRTQIQEFESNLSRSEETIKEYSAEIQSLKEQIDLKESELKDSEGRNVEYSHEIELLRSRNEELDSQIQEFESSLSRSEATIKEYSAGVQSLKEQIDLKQRELKDSEGRNVKYSREIELLRSRNEELGTQIQEFESNLSRSEATIKKYSAEVQSLKELIDLKERELKAAEVEKDELLREFEMLRSNNEELRTQNEEIKSNLSHSEESVKKYSADIHSLREIMDQKEQKLKDAEGEKEKYLNELQVSISKNENLIAQNEEFKLNLSRSEETAKKYSADIQNLIISEQSLKETVESNEKELNNAKNEIIKLVHDLETLRATYNNSNTENQELLSKLKLSEEMNMNIIVSLETDIKQRENEFDRVLAEKSELVANLTSINNELDLKLMKCKEDFEQLTLQNQEMASKVLIYEHKLDKLKSLNGCIEYFRGKISDTNVIIREDMNEYKRLIGKIQGALIMYADQLKNAEQQIKAEQNMKESLLTKNNELNELQNKLIIENQSIKEDFISLTRTIGMYNEELDKVVKNLKKGRDLSPELNDIQIAYSKFNIMSPIKSKDNGKTDEILELGQQISKINAYMDVYIEKETFYQKEIDNLKTELANLNSNYFDLTENFKEQNSDNEYQITSLTENLHSVVGKYNQLQNDHREYLNKISGYETEISKLKKLQSELTVEKDLDKMKLQEEILKLEEDILNLKRNRDNLIEEHQNEVKSFQDMKVEYETRLKDSEKQFESMSAEFAARVENLQIELKKSEVEIDSLKKKCEEKSKEKIKNSRSEEEYETLLAKLQVQVVGSKLEITKLEKEIQKLTSENVDLLGRITAVESNLEQERTNCEKLHKEVIAKDILLKESETSNTKFLEEKQVELQQKIDTLMKSTDVQKQTYEFFKLYYSQFKEKLDKLLSQRNILENLTSNLRILVSSINKIPVHETPNLRKLLEKKEAMEVISEDIMKQYSRYSKRINDIIFEIVQYYERNCDNLLSSLIIERDNYLDNYDMVDLSDQASDLTERTADALEQIRTLQKDLDNLNKAEEDIKKEKENILGSSNKINVEKMKEDELKKKNLALKQKVTLLDNAKSNLEKTVKKLREENRKLKETSIPTPDNDVHYKMLLQEYIAYKEEHEKIVEEHKVKLENLQKVKEYNERIMEDYKVQLENLQKIEEHKDDGLRTSTPFGDEHHNSMDRLQADLSNLQEAYANIRTINAKLEAENIRSRNIIEHHQQEAIKFGSIKEAYDKLLEENNKLMTDVDTIKYKRTRDRDEFLRLLKEKSEKENKNLRQIHIVKAEYEAKLERMKDKMIKLYRDELNKEMNKVKAGQHENSSLLKLIEKLRGDLFEAEQKNQLLEMEREMQKPKLEHFNSRESLYLQDAESRSLKDFSSVSTSANSTGTKPRVAAQMEFKHPRKVNPSSLETRKQYDDRRASTLPRTGTVLEEITISRRTSVGVPGPAIGPNLEMEDEEELFNNKYLADLKQGKCDLPSVGDRESRVSELAWRNSLVPPHLKSSYPAEMQFCSPGRFKDDDLKAGNVQFDDSLSKLLPAEKSRKKDSGTTSYKKPGPPTPSKNGGRLSLQGNEIHPARETYEVKRSTPSRIKALFTGRNSSKSNSEVTTPPKRRLSIFRR